MTFWSWFLFITEIAGLATMRQIAKRRIWWGWFLLILLMSVPWFIYGLTTEQWGFVALTLLWAGTYGANAITWKKSLKMPE